MSNRNNMIPIPGRLHSVAVGEPVAGADEVLDDTQNKKQNVINAELIEAVGTGGSVDTRIASAKAEIIGNATSACDTLGEAEALINAESTRAQNAENALGGRVTTLETAVGSNGSVDQRIAAAKSEVIGDAASDYNTLGKLEDKIQAEASARQDAITAETNRATTRENQIYDLVHTPEQHYVTVATYADLANIASPSDDTVYRVSSYNGKTSQVDNTVYSEYGYDGTNFVLLCVKSQIDEVYDISAHHSNNTYVDLAAALDGGNNIPQELRRGGMSIKFVQSSDNKYVQYRLMADEWSTNTEDWAIAEEGVYVENPEFVYVKTDKDDKILWGIKTDGEFYFGAGVPSQVISYIESRIADLSLDEYEDIVTFLNDLEKGTDNLSVLLDKKVDKAEGQSLIDKNFAESVDYTNTDSPEFIDVKLDAQEKVLEGTQKDGTKIFGADVNIGGSATVNKDLKVIGKTELDGISYEVIRSPEWAIAALDAEGKVLYGVKFDGKFYADLAGVDEKLAATLQEMQAEMNTLSDSIDAKIAAFEEKFNFISIEENPEFIQVTTDSEGKILQSRNPEGVNKEYVGLETPNISTKSVDIDGATIENIEDPEGRTEIKTDAEGKILSYRDGDGVMHENVGITTPHLNLVDDGMTEFQQALKDSGFQPGGSGDWSDNESLEIPMPRCAIVNITNDSNNAVWPISKTADYQYYLQFWDMQGNYFKKPVIYNAQGNSSLGMPKKNAGFDMFADTWDGESFTLKIGNWVPQDSFHLKAYYADYFVGVCPIGYRLFDQITSTRDIFTNRDWKKAFLPSKATIGTGCRAMDGEDDKYSLDNDARCFPDGFPCIVYLNGEFYGVYSWQLKKHRDNYMMSKKKPNHIHLDGVINNLRLFGANGDSSKIGWVDEGDTGFEIRNPKPKKKKDGWDLTCIDGTKYDADTNMKEIIGQDDPLYDSTNESHVKTNQTKQAILQLSTYISELNQMESSSTSTEAIKARLSEMFDIQSFIDYLVFCDITANYDGFAKNWQWITYDGNKWFIEPYDLDGIFGWSGWGEISPNDGRYGNDKSIPSGWIIQYYQTELEARYAELRQNGIFTRNSILRIFRDWIAAIGTENFQKNHDKWPNDREHYSAGPIDTHYDNIYRVSNWLDARIAKCDEIYNNNQN